MSDVSIPPMTLGRTLRAYLSDARYESLRLLRTPAFAIPILAMPILFYSFFGVVLAGKAVSGGFANQLFVGWTVYGVMGPGLFGFGILVAVERNQGLLTFKRALPMPAGSYLSSKLLMALVFAVVVMAKGRRIAEGTVAEIRALVVRKRVDCVTATKPSTIAAWSGVTGVTEEAGRLSITTTDAEDTVRRLLAADKALSDLEVRRAGLSEAFAELTQEPAE